MGIKYRKIHANIVKQADAIEFVYPKGFAEAFEGGYVGFLNRSIWPPQRLMDNTIAVQPEDIRTDYVEAEVILKRHIQQSEKEGKSYIVWRANIPLNLGVAWFEKGKWWHHPEDTNERFIDSKLLCMDRAILKIYANTEPQPFNTFSTLNLLALLTPCLGVNTFDADMYFSGLYDIRHALAIQNKWPRKPSWPQETLIACRNAKQNQIISRITALFSEDRKHFITRLRDEIDISSSTPKWGRYNRTVFVTSANPGSLQWTIIVMGKTTPPEAFDIAAKISNIANPVVFTLVEGGSFSAGVIHQGKIYDLSNLKSKTVDYYRGARGLWYTTFQIEHESAENLINMNVEEWIESP